MTGMDMIDDLMNARRIELGLRWEEVAERAGIRRSTLHNVRRGKPTKINTDRAIEDVLQWERGSLEAIRHGGKPAPLHRPPDTTQALMDVWALIKQHKGEQEADRWLRIAHEAIAASQRNHKIGP